MFREHFRISIVFRRLILILFLLGAYANRSVNYHSRFSMWNNICDIYCTPDGIANLHDAVARERALESSVEDLTDSLSYISVSARRRGPRYLLGDLPTICQRSTGRVPALSNIYRTPLPLCVYCGELSHMHVCARVHGRSDHQRAGHRGIAAAFSSMIDSNLRSFFERTSRRF